MAKAKPDTQDGFMMIALELFPILTSYDFPKREWAILTHVLMRCYGPRKARATEVDCPEIEHATGLDRRNARRALRSLVAKGVLARDGTSGLYRFVKDYQSWSPKPSGAAVAFARAAVAIYGPKYPRAAADPRIPQESVGTPTDVHGPESNGTPMEPPGGVQRDSHKSRTESSQTPLKPAVGVPLDSPRHKEERASEELESSSLRSERDEQDSALVRPDSPRGRESGLPPGAAAAPPPALDWLPAVCAAADAAFPGTDLAAWVRKNSARFNRMMAFDAPEYVRGAILSAKASADRGAKIDDLFALVFGLVKDGWAARLPPGPRPVAGSPPGAKYSPPPGGYVRAGADVPRSRTPRKD